MPRIVHALSSLCLLLGPTVAHAGPAPDSTRCPVLEEALVVGERLVVDGPASEGLSAEEAIAEVQLALACAPPAATTDVARVLRLQGALWVQQGAQDEADLAFASAARLDPAGWTPSFDAQLLARFEAAGTRSAQLGSGRLRLEPAPPDAFSTWLNGEETTLPAMVPSGLHLVQVVASYDAPAAPGVSRSARLALVFDQDDLVVDPGPVPLTPPWLDTGSAMPAAPKGPSVARITLLASGGVLAVGSGVTALLARAQSDRATSATSSFLKNPPSGDAAFTKGQKATLDEIDSAEAAQKVYAVSTWALLGLGVTSVGVAFVF